MKKEMNDEYLTDKELEALIAEVEEQELICAPVELKERILSAVQEVSASSEGKDAGEDKPLEMADEIARPPEQGSPVRVPQRDKRRELLLYSMRVVLAAAASIAVLLAMPTASELSLGMSEFSRAAREMQVERKTEQMKRERQEGAEEKASLLELCNNGTSSFCAMLNQATTKILN